MNNELPILSITTENRVRKDHGNINELAESIKQFGLIQPIVVDRNNRLVAGERRLKAVQSLGWTTLRHGKDFIYNDEVDDIKLRAMEFEENFRRKNLTWQEEVIAKRRLLDLMQQIHGQPSGGRPVAGSDAGFGINKLAAMLGESPALVSKDIELAEFVELIPALSKAETKEAARRMATTLVMQQAAVPVRAGVEIHECQFQQNMLPDESVDLVITDPPYGESIGGLGPKSQMEAGFTDSREHTVLLYFDLAKHSFRVLKQDRFAFFFFGMSLYADIVSAAVAAGFDVVEAPLIWVKNVPIFHDAYTRFGRCYEPILVARKGNPRLVIPSRKDVLEFPIPAPSERVHPAQKPVPLIKALIEATTVEGMTVVDFCAGSGTTGVAASELKRKAILYESNPESVKIAKARLGGV